MISSNANALPVGARDGEAADDLVSLRDQVLRRHGEIRESVPER
jgi:hypothetical protein